MNSDKTNSFIVDEISKMKKEIEKQKKLSPKDKLSMVIFSGDLDKIIAAFIIATGAAAMGSEVNMFFTFWRTAALRDPKKRAKKKTLLEKMFGFMIPKGIDNLSLSKMNMGGIGGMMIKWLMKKKGVATLSELLDIADQSDVEISVCEMSMNLLGFKKEELIEFHNMNYVGVAPFLESAYESRITLFI